MPAESAAIRACNFLNQLAAMDLWPVLTAVVAKLDQSGPVQSLESIIGV